MNSFKIADIKMNIETDNKYLKERMKIFQTYIHKNPDMMLNIQSCNHINEPSGTLLVDESLRWLKKENGESGYHIYAVDQSRKHVIAHMDTNEDWSRVSISCLHLNYEPEDTDAEDIEMFDWMEYYSFMLAGIAFRNHLLTRDGIVIHSSSISWEGKGIVFTAPSGTGKSTHVKLWERYIGQKVTTVNDDTPAIRIKEGDPVLYGTPWSGSTDKFNNTSVPLAAVVVLEQSSENTIRELSAAEALPKVMPRSFLPYFDENLMIKAYEVLEKIISSVPFYLLRSRPDKEAVELVYQCVR